MVERDPLGVKYRTREDLELVADVPGTRMWAVALEKTMLTYFEVEPNRRFEMHVHESEQITTVLTGMLFFQVGEATYRVGPGEVIAVPSNQPHAVWTEAEPVTAFDAWSTVMAKYGR